MNRKLVSLAILCLALCLVLGGVGTALAESAAVDHWARYEEPVTVRLAVNGEEDGFTWDDNIWTQTWEEQFNIKTEIMWSTGTDDAYNTKLSLAILSNDLPDYIITANYNQFLQIVDAGSAMDVTELFPTWAYPTLYEFLNVDGLTQTFGMIDGVRYGINPYGANGTDTRLVYIRMDYLEKVGGTLPTTMEGVIDLGKKFVDEGLAKYALPLTGKVVEEGYSDIRAMANAFGAYPGIWVEQDGKLAYGSTLPGMEQALNVYKDLYNGGYIDPTFATAVGDTLTAQIMNGEVGILTGDFWIYTWPLPDLKDETGKIVDWQAIAIPASETNADFHVQGGSSTGEMIVIREGYEHPDAVFKLMNHRCAVLNDPALQNMDFQEVTDADGTRIQNHMRCPIREYFSMPNVNMYTSPAVTEAFKTGDATFDNPQFESTYNNLVKYFDAEKAGDIAGMNSLWLTYKLFYGEESGFGQFYKCYEDGMYIYDATGGYQSQNYSRLWGTLTQFENNFYVNYIGGTEPTTFEEFLQGWNETGGELLTYELNNR